MRKWISKFLISAAAVYALFAVSNYFLLPNLSEVLRKQILRVGNQTKNSKVEITSLRFQLTNPVVHATGIRYTLMNDKGEVKKDKMGNPVLVTVDEAVATMDWVKLFAGRLSLSQFELKAVNVDVDLQQLPENNEAATDLPLKKIFQITQLLPLEKIKISDVSVQVKHDKMRSDVALKTHDLEIFNHGKSVTLETEPISGKIHYGQWQIPAVEISLKTQLGQESLVLHEGSVKALGAKLEITGSFTDVKQVFHNPQFTMNLKLSSELKEIEEQLNALLDSKLKLQGSVVASSTLKREGPAGVNGNVSFETSNVIINQLTIGSSRLEGMISEQELKLSEVVLEHPAGTLKLESSYLRWKPDLLAKFNLKVDSLSLFKLLESLGIKAPVDMNISGNAECDSLIKGKLLVTCDTAHIVAKNIWVKTDLKNKSTLVDIPLLEANGDFFVDTEGVQYSATLKAPHSSGKSEGYVQYKKGFNVQYEANDLDFLDVKNLANLNLQGRAALKGSTQGNSSAATFNIKATAKDFSLDKFFLGSLFANLDYAAGGLKFTDVDGAINQSQYKGNLNFDFNAEKLAGELTMPTLNLQDLRLIFLQKVPAIPKMSGSGSAKMQFSGPFEFWKLSYDMESSFKAVTLDTEPFDALKFAAQSDGQTIILKDANLKKGDTTVNITGSVSSDQDLRLKLSAQNFKVEESIWLNQFVSGIQGVLNLNGELNGNISSPDFKANGKLTSTYLDQQEVPDSSFGVGMGKKALTADLALFGNKIKGDLQIPWEENSLPLKMNVHTENWNFSSLIGLLNNSTLSSEYGGLLSGDLNLTADNGSWKSVTGGIQISQLQFSRGPVLIKNNRKLEVDVEKGRYNIKNFRLSGEKSYFEISGPSFTSDQLNLQIAGNLNLHLFQIFLPFFDEFGGNLNFQTAISGKPSSPLLLGNAELKSGFLKFKGFPHAAEQVTAQVQFSQSNIFISELKGVMAGGPIEGSGSVIINSVSDLPTQINLKASNVSLNVPDKVHTFGSGELSLSGSHLPLLLAGSFDVQSAFVDKEFTESSDNEPGLKQSIYLPSALKDKSLNPLNLNIALKLPSKIIVKNSLIDGTVSGNLQISGPTNQIVILGSLDIAKKSKLIFKDKQFEVQTGEIRFENPTEIDPNLFISAQSRIENYDISLLAQGPAKNLSIKLTSSPPLPDQDIFALIALGVSSNVYSQNSQSKTQAEQTGMEIGGALISKPINKQLENTLGVKLQVSSQFDATKNISVPKVTLSRNVTDNVKVSGSRPVGSNEAYDLKVEYLINNNITAVGSFENRGLQDNTTTQTQQQNISIFGLDLEFKKEFK